MSVLIAVTVFFLFLFVGIYSYQSSVESQNDFKVSDFFEEFNPYTDQTIFSADSDLLTRIKPVIVLNNKSKRFHIKITFTISLAQKISHFSIKLDDETKIFYNDKVLSDLTYNDTTNIFTKNSTSITFFLKEDDIAFFKKFKSLRIDPEVRFHSMSITTLTLYDADITHIANIIVKAEELFASGCTYDNKSYLFIE